MFWNREKTTVIADGLKIAGSVSAEGEVELHGEIEGDIHCASLSILPGGRIAGKVHADNVLVNGTVDGPIHGAQVTLGATARVCGDVHHESFVVERGAFFAGSSLQEKRPTAERLAQAGADEYAAFKRSVSSTRRRKPAAKSGDGAKCKVA